MATAAKNRTTKRSGKTPAKKQWTGPVVPMPSGEIIPIDGYGSDVVILDPPTAKAWLESMKRNRTLKERKIDQFAGAMRRGEWKYNGQSCGFDKQGHLLDGQHRCHAVLRANKSVPTLVTWGLEDDAQDTMDVGTSRSFKDALQMRGETNAPEQAAITRHMLLWEKYGRIGVRGEAPTIPQLHVKWQEHEDEIRDSVKATAKLRRNGLRFPESVSGLLWILFGRVDLDDRDVFFEYLASGAGLDEDDPIFAFRRILIKQMSKQYQIDVAMIGALAIKTFNKWRRGERVSLLTWKGGGASPEPFPKIDDYPDND